MEIIQENPMMNEIKKAFSKREQLNLLKEEVEHLKKEFEHILHIEDLYYRCLNFQDETRKRIDNIEERMNYINNRIILLDNFISDFSNKLL